MKAKWWSVALTAAVATGFLSGAAVAQAEEQVTLKVFSNLPDSKNGQGLVEQMIIDEYMSENPNVTIEVEALDEVLEAGVLAELNEADYAEMRDCSRSAMILRTMERRRIRRICKFRGER